MRRLPWRPQGRFGVREVEAGRRAGLGGVLEASKVFAGGQVWGVETKEGSQGWGPTELGGGTGVTS